ncbi:MAG: hypothetical protein BEN18_08645 [Epulopiscium sp. Nuni2H_MBin001]|nr:MAG: hypothetical protein BEN18_08645 [Epulopiscium sp. Nuni2H_MBin001]
MYLSGATEKVNYRVKAVSGNDDIRAFLSTLGCYENTEIVVLKKTRSNYIIGINGVRYGVDMDIVSAIELCE